MINAIIVDDEPYCCEALAILLGRYCPQVEVIGCYHSGSEALVAIRERKPQLLFLDIEMPRMNGFELLEKVKDLSFELIFTTSYDQYAIKAIRFSALDYLLKPIDREELVRSVQKVDQRLQSPLPQQIDLLFQKLQGQTSQFSKIAIPTMEGLQMVAVDSIIHCASDSNYTILTLKDQQRVVASRTLKEIEELLEDYSFVRVHHSNVVNLNEINKYIKGEGGYLVMSDGSSVNVSRSRKEGLLRKLQPNRT
ncbi:MAG: response regulator transcription factor [Bacteroidetes bacterium]|nr:response regulator transcription factor [Bacteroidota bacterium]